MTGFKGNDGKWKVIKREKTDYAPKTNEIQFGDNGECVAEFVENDYDAQLMAHAPEMLEMLRYIYEETNFQSHFPTTSIKVKNLLKRATTI